MLRSSNVSTVGKVQNKLLLFFFFWTCSPACFFHLFLRLLQHKLVHVYNFLPDRRGRGGVSWWASFTAVFSFFCHVFSIKSSLFALSPFVPSLPLSFLLSFLVFFFYFFFDLCARVCFVRSPIPRLVSAYFYCKKSPVDGLCASMIVNADDVDLYTFAEHWGNYGLRQFTLAYALPEDVLNFEVFFCLFRVYRKVWTSTTGARNTLFDENTHTIHSEWNTAWLPVLFLFFVCTRWTLVCIVMFFIDSLWYVVCIPFSFLMERNSGLVFS